LVDEVIAHIGAAQTEELVRKFRLLYTRCADFEPEMPPIPRRKAARKAALSNVISVIDANVIAESRSD